MKPSRLLLATALVFVAASVSQSASYAQKTPKYSILRRIDHDIRPVVINTLQMVPQIDTRKAEMMPERPENPLAPLPIGKKNNLVPGRIREVARGTTLAHFPGITMNGWYPPDCTLAVGPNHIIETVNQSIAFYDKSGNQQFLQIAPNFFTGLGAGNFQFDPKCFYERIHQRFVMIFLEQDTNSQTSKVLLAVSDDSDPNGTWYRYRLEAKLVLNNVPYWHDYPGFGYNKDAFVVSGNMFTFSGNIFGGVQFLVIPSASLFSGGTATVKYGLDTNAASVQMCDMVDLNVDKIYGVSVATTSSFRIHAFTNLAGSTVFYSTTVAVPSFITPQRNATSTQGNTLDSLDGRVYNASWRYSKIVTSHCAQNANGSGNLQTRWYQFDTANWPTSGTPSLTQSGVLDSGSSDYHMSGIGLNGAGDISAIFSRSSTTITADIMYAARLAGDPLGTMGTPNLLESSLGNNYILFRWGDYFRVDVDPTDDLTFWGVSMDVNSNNQWKTSIFSWKLASQPPPAPTGLTASPSNAQVTLNWNTSQFASSFNIKRSDTSGGPYNLVGTSSTTMFTDTGLTNGHTYYYVVSSVNAAGESPNSTEVSATPAELVSLTVNPTVVFGGMTSTGTVTIDIASPADTIVSLASVSVKQ